MWKIRPRLRNISERASKCYSIITLDTDGKAKPKENGLSRDGQKATTNITAEVNPAELIRPSVSKAMGRKRYVDGSLSSFGFIYGSLYCRGPSYIYCVSNILCCTSTCAAVTS